ncbi:pilus assembly FimT family protein [Franzmannia pantelleriensis]|uniref:pilus assembly FimT family protein n=1 Tax=Franzmannia pantelleriensis TaxID=48727 RepID=UPI001FE1109D|nr:prepilin-type N-terminal cleavage/methylation domain-containing protein [Halomonas pantelleriensis]
MSAGRVTRNSGLTLIELLVTMAVAIILATIAVPSYFELRQQQQLSASTNDVLSMVLAARREAVSKRLDGVEVTLGADKGWPISIVRDGSAIYERAASHPSIEIALASGGELIFNRFGRTGGEVSICISRAGDVHREISILLSGQVRNLRDELENCDD